MTVQVQEIKYFVSEFSFFHANKRLIARKVPSGHCSETGRTGQCVSHPENALSTTARPQDPTTQLRQLSARFAKPHLGRAVWQIANTLSSVHRAVGTDGVERARRLELRLDAAARAAGLGPVRAHLHHPARLRPRFVLRQSESERPRSGGVSASSRCFRTATGARRTRSTTARPATSTAARIGDIVTLTVSEYRARPWFGRLLYRLYRIHAGAARHRPVLPVRDQAPLPVRHAVHWKKEWASVLINNAVLAAGAIALMLADRLEGTGSGAAADHSDRRRARRVAVLRAAHVRARVLEPQGNLVLAEGGCRRQLVLRPAARRCTGSPATSAITTCTIWRAASRTTACAKRSNRARCCSGRRA